MSDLKICFILQNNILQEYSFCYKKKRRKKNCSCRVTKLIWKMLGNVIY